MKHEDDELINALARSAEKLDEADVKTPDFAFFKGMVESHQAAVRRAQKRQLALFILVAVVLVSALMLCMGRFALIFIALNGIAFAGAVVTLLVFYLKKPKEALQ